MHRIGFEQNSSKRQAADIRLDSATNEIGNSVIIAVNYDIMIE
jgi:hypothetical protein